MARKPKKTEETGLLAALKFVQAAQDEIGTVYQTHCRFLNHYVVGFNGVLGAGHPVQEEMPICPHTYRLINALERVGGAMSLTALDTKQLSIKSDKFRALVSCIGDGDLTYVVPDLPQWPINDEWKKAAIIASTFNTDGAQTVMAAAVVTRDQSIIGTQGTVVLEAWHGIPTPPGLIIPKGFINALAKVTKPMVRFGFSHQSFTVWFEDQSWLRTQLYQEQYPNVDLVLAYTETAHPTPITKDIYEGIRAVAPFADTSMVWLGGGQVRSHETPDKGAVYEAKGAVSEVAVNAKQMLALEEYIVQIDFTGNEKVICFFGDKLRGAMAKAASDVTKHRQQAEPQQPQYGYNPGAQAAQASTIGGFQRMAHLDDEIPF